VKYKGCGSNPYGEEELRENIQLEVSPISTKQ
jgi:hypothetical protein